MDNITKLLIQHNKKHIILNGYSEHNINDPELNVVVVQKSTGLVGTVVFEDSLSTNVYSVIFYPIIIENDDCRVGFLGYSIEEFNEDFEILEYRRR